MAVDCNRVGVCRYRSFSAPVLPRSRSRRTFQLPESAGYSDADVEQFLRDEQAKDFRMPPLPEGCNFVIVSLPKAVMRAYRQQERAWLNAKQTQR